MNDDYGTVTPPDTIRFERNEAEYSRRLGDG
jgi:hypothetical protein